MCTFLTSTRLDECTENVYLRGDKGRKILIQNLKALITAKARKFESLQNTSYNASIYVPSHRVISRGFTANPGSQLQVYPPTVLVQIC